MAVFLEKVRTYILSKSKDACLLGIEDLSIDESAIVIKNEGKEALGDAGVALLAIPHLLRAPLLAILDLVRLALV